MNKVILMGRPTADPEIRHSTGEDLIAVGRYTLAVNRRYVKEGEQDADFIRCVAFGKAAEFAEKWIKKGIKIVVTGRIQTGSYTNKEGVKIYTTEVVVEDQEFAESKRSEATENTETNAENNSSELPAENGESLGEVSNEENSEELHHNKETESVKKAGKKKKADDSGNS